MQDVRGRELHDVRLSVTDRCNFRCSYCMPAEVFGPDFAFLPRAELLTFEEIALVARELVALGARTLRITGGEPLVRRDLERLVALLRALDSSEALGGDPLDIALTTVGKGMMQWRAREGQPMPLDWALTPDGHETDDPQAAMAGDTAAATGPDHAGDGLWQALQRATGRDPATLGLPPLEHLRASGAAKRALWPRLRALRRP